MSNFFKRFVKNSVHCVHCVHSTVIVINLKCRTAFTLRSTAFILNAVNALEKKMNAVRVFNFLIISVE